ncbi:uncharacterized protein [Watersipora subatra]|uniref:uncharacterized protein n=1 Tax=Watersipora subatra TaxID=2589382 RepID=UPI00355B4550
MTELHDFGSSCTFYTEGHKQKLQPKEQAGIYLSVNLKNQGHYIFDTQTNRILTSRNVHVYRRLPDNNTADTQPLTDDYGTLDLLPLQRRGSKQTVVNDTKTPTPNSTENTETPRRSSRERKPPTCLTDYQLTTSVDYAYAAIPFIPKTYDEAVNSEDASKWKAAMNKEMITLTNNDTLDIKPLPKDRTERKGK